MQHLEISDLIRRPRANPRIVARSAQVRQTPFRRINPPAGILYGRVDGRDLRRSWKSSLREFQRRLRGRNLVPGELCGYQVGVFLHSGRAGVDRAMKQRLCACELATSRQCKPEVVE